MTLTILPLPQLQPGHANCENNRCQTCSNTHTKLQQYIEQRVYNYMTRHVDVLGAYRSHLERDRNIFCETPHGWADTRFFDEENVHEYIRWELEHRADPDNEHDPSMAIEVSI